MSQEKLEESHKDKKISESPSFNPVNYRLGRQFFKLGRTLDNSSISSAENGESIFNQNIADELLANSKERRENKIQNRNMRSDYARRAINIVYLVMSSWILCFFSVGISNLCMGRSFLSDQALITFTAGATTNVFTALIIILKGLFPSKSNSSK